MFRYLYFPNLITFKTKLVIDPISKTRLLLLSSSLKQASKPSKLVTALRPDYLIASTTNLIASFLSNTLSA